MDPFTQVCAGKYGYPNFDTAQNVIRCRKNKKKKNGAKLGVYRCPFCRKWHVGGSRRSAVMNDA